MIFDVRTQASDKDTDMRGGLQTSGKPIAFIIFTFDRLKWYRERYLYNVRTAISSAAAD